jgi:Protein of unknown function (DUF2505)
MPRPIRYQSRYTCPAVDLFAILVTREYLQARLDRIGGNNAVLLELASDAETAKYTLRQGVNHEYLPGPIQKILRGDLVIERSETWRLVAAGRYEGTVTAKVKDAPGSIGGALALADLGGPGSSNPNPAGSQLSIDGQAKVDVPLIGGKIESAIAEQVVKLMEREARFTADWLARGPSR